MATVRTPREGYDGVSVGVRFRDGVGETDNPAALAYFARAGYGIEQPPTIPEVPGDKAPKADWVAYAVALHEVDPDRGLAADDANDLTRDQLAERFRPRTED